MPGSPLLSIAALSAFILFVEMLLVRWVGTELRVFAYLQNGVLVAAFLGLGLGARNSRLPVHALGAVLAMATLAFVIRDPLGLALGEAVTQGLVAFQDTVIWSKQSGLPPWTRVPIAAFALAGSLGLLAAVAWAFRPLGQWLGAWMDAHPRPIAAYTANILGSLAGIGLFVGATLLRTPPRAWLAVAAAGYAVLALRAADRPPARALAVAMALGLPFMTAPNPALTTWSPYQKLAVVPQVAYDAQAVCGEQILVNGVGYQGMVNLDPAHLAANPQLYPPDRIRFSHYILPYGLIGPRPRVLVVGAGSGNDVAGALRAGATSVRAVEIDPVIVELGRSRHPERPYADPRVQVVVDDARAFFGKDRGGPYDLVWFGLLDSHTTPSAYSNVRLDHFVYTKESFEAMHRLLAPDGVVVLFFEAETYWMAARLVALMSETFGAPPLAARIPNNSCLGWGGFMLIGGSPRTMAPIRERMAGVTGLQTFDTAAWPRPYPSTDDWPYLYLERPQVPTYHLLVAFACLALVALLRRRLYAGEGSSDLAMLLLGMGFMLLEVSGVSRAALLFGTTWTVNAWVVGSILGMVLLANFVASRVPVPASGWPAVGLLASLVAVALVPTSALAGLPLHWRIPLGAGFLALPVFFSGLIFVTAWAATERKDLALGSNLLGSLLGGIASMLSMVIGFRALVFLTVAIYLGALLALRARMGAPAPAGPAPETA